MQSDAQSGTDKLYNFHREKYFALRFFIVKGDANYFSLLMAIFQCLTV